MLYRRHKANCSHRAKGRAYQACPCPLWAEGRSLRTNDWAVAQRAIAGPHKPKAKASRAVEHTQPYSQAEVEAIRTACGKLKTLGAQHRATALIALLSETGMRISDASLLRRDAIQRQDDGQVWLHFRAKKNGNEVTLPLQELTYQLLTTLYPVTNTVTNSGSGEFYFHSVSSKPERTIARMERLLSRVFRLSGVPHAHAHRWRHSLASRLAETGADLRLIARVLGDTIEVAEKHYIKLTKEYRGRVAEAFEAINRK